MPKSYFNPKNVFHRSSYSHAVKTGNMIFVSGQVAVDVSGEIVGRGNISIQAEQAWVNMKYVLEAAGARLTDLVDVTTYITDPKDIVVIREVRERFFNHQDKPTSTLVVAKELANPDLLIEIKGIAVLD